MGGGGGGGGGGGVEGFVWSDSWTEKLAISGRDLYIWLLPQIQSASLKQQLLHVMRALSYFFCLQFSGHGKWSTEYWELVVTDLK